VCAKTLEMMALGISIFVCVSFILPCHTVSKVIYQAVNVSSPMINTSNGLCNVTWGEKSSLNVLQKVLKSRVNLIFLDTVFEGGRREQLVWTENRRGEGLLFLNEHFEQLSLYTLSVGVKRMDIYLKDLPRGCLYRSRNNSTVKYDLMKIMLTGFSIQNRSETNRFWSDNGKLCTFQDDKQEYKCCNINKEGIVHCSVLKSNMWLMILKIIIFCFVIIAVYVSPYMIVKIVDIKNFKCKQYEHRLNSKICIKILKNTQPSNDSLFIKSKELKQMSYLLSAVENIETEKTITVNKALFNVIDGHIMSMNDSPTSIVHSLYTSLFLCKCSLSSTVMMLPIDSVEDNDEHLLPLKV